MIDFGPAGHHLAQPLGCLGGEQFAAPEGRKQIFILRPRILFRVSLNHLDTLTGYADRPVFIALAVVDMQDIVSGLDIANLKAAEIKIADPVVGQNCQDGESLNSEVLGDRDSNIKFIRIRLVVQAAEVWLYKNYRKQSRW